MRFKKAKHFFMENLVRLRLGIEISTELAMFTLRIFLKRKYVIFRFIQL